MVAVPPTGPIWRAATRFAGPGAVEVSKRTRYDGRARGKDPMSDTATHGDFQTIADYELFVEGMTGDERWELIRGRIVMMTNPSESHGQIVGGIFAPLRAAMNAAGCRVYAGGMRVQRSEDRGGDMTVIPDIVVRCGPRRDRDFVTDPMVVVEVLSRSTMHRDRGVKFDFYRSLPSLRHIVLVYQDQMRVEHFRRGASGWAVEVLSSSSRRLDLEAVGFSIDLETIYFDVPVLRPVEAPGEDEPEPPTPIA